MYLLELLPAFCLYFSKYCFWNIIFKLNLLKLVVFAGKFVGKLLKMTAGTSRIRHFPSFHRINPSIHPSTHQSINPSIHQSINTSIHPSTHEPINPSIHQSINSSIQKPKIEFLTTKRLKSPLLVSLCPESSRKTRAWHLTETKKSMLRNADVSS